MLPPHKPTSLPLLGSDKDFPNIAYAFNTKDDNGNYTDEGRWDAKDEWTYSRDPAFLASLLAEPRSNSMFSCDVSSTLCKRCRSINLNTPISSPHNPENGCALCEILSKCYEEARNDKSTTLLQARQHIRICAVPKSQDSSLPIGLPRLLDSGTQLHFELIKAWIRLCDEGNCSGRNGCCPSKPDRSRMPTRVIDVGDGHTAHLVLSDNIHHGAHYIALSHCWGNVWKDLSEERKELWSATCKSVQRKIEGFLVKTLPQAFQDAITVTRELGQRYLWIDSLCIIQGDHKDWDTESKKMQAVFQNAYCTIAATSAEGSEKGFLNRPKEEISQCVMVPESSHGKVYISTLIDDFDGDVVQGILNTRAWVLQERALSRRTIHFTKKQTYWECGGGVRCETLTHMRNEKLSFQSDPEFPRSMDDRSEEARVLLFQSLFEDYSSLGITEEADRPVVILSLAEALAEALETEVYYGIFKCYLGRSLLWQPARSTLTQISYKTAPPSWSWMAYRGPIQYFPIEFASVEWDNSVQLIKVKAQDTAASPEDNAYVLEARVRRLRDCKVDAKAGKCVILDKKNKEVGQLYFNTEPPEVRCAILGREKIEAKDGDRMYYVLFVTECTTQSKRGKFETVGVGSIEKRLILFSGQDNTAQIV